MIRRICALLAVAGIILLTCGDDLAFGRGGRGGGGRGGGGGMSRGGGGGVSRGGGGGMSRGGGYSRGASRPSANRTPSFSQPRPRPTTRPAPRPSASTTRPGISAGTRPSTRPSTRPGIAQTRPGLTPGTRPSVGSRPGGVTRPSTLDRPGIASRPGVGGRPGISTLPAAGVGAGIGAGLAGRPGIGERPTTLPGLGGDRLPGRGERPQSPQERRDNLQSRLQDAQNRAGERPENRPADRQDWQNERREDWQDWADNNHWHHDDWYHGPWHGHWGGWWDHMWDEHPLAGALGLTWWGLNRWSYASGYYPYYNPYYTEPVAGTTAIDYSEPLVITEEAAPEATVPAPEATEPLPPGVTQAGMDMFTQARAAFYDGKYSEALKLTDAALAEMPKDATVHEFRSLVLFALKRYSESAAAIHAVLAVGPGWDWTTMSSLYTDVKVYESQLRALDSYCKEHPDAADAHLLLGYHYLTTGELEGAKSALRRVTELQPKDIVAASLLQTLSESEPKFAPQQPEATTVAKGPAIRTEDLVGTWTATRPDKSRFNLTLTKDGNFTWAYARGPAKQEVKGVFAVEQNSLAMEPASGGVMLADLSLEQPGELHFAVVGAPENDPGLDFRRSKQ